MRTISAILLACTLTLSAMGEQPNGARDIATSSIGARPMIPMEIQQSVRQRVDHGYCPGMVVAIVTPEGKDFFGYGRTALPNGSLPDKDTVFEIGSVTKVFTGLLLADMVEQHELTLDDPIGELLPRGVGSPIRGGKSIALIDLATHTSGLPRIPDNLRSQSLDDAYAGYTPELLYTFLAGHQLQRDIGSKFEYSNYGMGLLGELLARKGDATYEALIRQRICEELGMPDTAITLTPAMQERFAKGHRGNRQAANWDLGALAGAGGLRSTANDLLTFLAANIGLRETSLRQAMKSAQEPRRPTDMGNMQVGLAWLVLAADKQRICWHDGGTGGYCSFIGFDTAEKKGIAVLTNGAQDVSDLGLHFLVPAVPLADYSAPAKRMAKPVSVSLLPGEKLPSGETVWERAIDQLGGRSAIAKIQNRRIEAQVEIEFLGAGIKGPAIVYQARPDRAYTKVDIAGLISAEEGTSGDFGWEVDSSEGGRIVAGRENEVKRVVDPFDLAAGKELYQEWKCEGKFLVDGQTCHKVVAISKNHAIPVTWYFAVDSGWPVGKEYDAEQDGAKKHIEERLSDYRPVDKVMCPFELQQLIDGVIVRTHVTRIEHDVLIPAGRFDLPEKIKRLKTSESSTPVSSAK